jgi:hypothetical protein
MMQRWQWPVAALCVIGAVASQCGGTTSPGSPDASTDATGSSGSASSGSGSASGSSGGGCSPACTQGLACCGGACVNTGNDPHNCGTCGTVCQDPTPYCAGSCKPVPCEQDAAACVGVGTCCGTGCCTQGQICCQLEEGPWVTQCVAPTSPQNSCPVGCPECVSDRNLKRAFEPVDPQQVLETLSRIPISTWSYKSDDPSVRHMGPMAQDLHAAFGLGDTDKAYNPVDAHGVAFAAIQALAARLDAQDARIRRLEEENAGLRAACR